MRANFRFLVDHFHWSEEEIQKGRLVLFLSDTSAKILDVDWSNKQAWHKSFESFPNVSEREQIVVAWLNKSLIFFRSI